MNESFIWPLDGWVLQGHPGVRNLGNGRGDGAPSIVLWKQNKAEPWKCEERLTPHSSEFAPKLAELFGHIELQRIEAQA